MAYATYTFMDNELVGLQHDGRQRDVATDPQGSVVHLMTSFFVSSDTLSYWPYGQQRSKSGTVNIPFHYAGAHGYYEDTSNRLYVRARYYRADLGNWITKDPLWPQEPAYAYVRGNPTNYVDPSGQWVIISSSQTAIAPKPIMPPGWQLVPGGGLARPIPPPIPIYPDPLSCSRSSQGNSPRSKPRNTVSTQKRDYKNCTDTRYATLQSRVKAVCGSEIDWGEVWCEDTMRDLHSIEWQIKYNRICAKARENVCKCFVGGCDKSHQDVIDSLRIGEDLCKQIAHFIRSKYTA